MKLVGQELGPRHVASDIGCHLFSILPPFEIRATTIGYGLGPASNAAFNVKTDRKPIAVMGDGGFWPDAATWMRRLREAALRDASGHALDGTWRTVRSFLTP